MKVDRGALAPGCPAHANDGVKRFARGMRLAAVLRKRGATDLSGLSFQRAVAVAGEVVGLTEGRGSMAKRLARFFALVPDGDTTIPAGRIRPENAAYELVGLVVAVDPQR